MPKVSPTELEFIFRLIEKLYDDLVNETYEGSKQYIKEAYEKGLAKGNADLKKVGWSFDIPPDPNSIEFLEGYQFDLIKGVGEDVKKEIKRVIRDGIIDGKSMRQIAKDLREVGFTNKKWRLNTIARTETMRAANYGRYEAWTKSGVVKYKQWLTAYDDRVCAECEGMNGEIVELDKPFSSGDLMPPLHPNCRCTAIPVFDKSKLQIKSQPIKLSRKEEINVKSIEAKYAAFLRTQFKKGIKQAIEVWRHYGA